MSRDAIKSTGKAMPSAARAPFTERGALRIVVEGVSFFPNCRDSIVALASRVASQASYPVNHFLRGADVSRAHFAMRPFGASFLLHCSLVALLIYLPRTMSVWTLATLPTPTRAERIYYWVPLLDSPKKIRLSPAAPHGRPDSGSLPARVPALGSAAPQRNLMIVSKPVHPDNRRQTIYQPASPPDLKITTEQKLPDIVRMQPLQKPKAVLHPSDARPTQVLRQVSAIPAPTINTNPANPLMTLLPPSETQPHLTIPLGPPSAPILRAKDSSGSVVEESSGDTADLMVLGVDPAGATTQFSLPGGNRWGEFSIAPPSGTPGSPGGDPKGAVGGGKGGGTSGGELSTGVGSGGNGGGKSGTAGPVSIAGPGDGEGPGGLLDPTLLNSMVYLEATPAAIMVRKNALVISAGPSGGGGLNLYGALNCRKIYSIFLPMPGKNWSLQYCDKSAGPEKVMSEGGTVVVHVDEPLVPPDFDPAHRFNFKRIPVPAEKSHRSIILKGVIATDGSVQHLAVYQGVIPEMDEAARIAFSRWRFKPAMKDGKPIEVEMLVGIPPLTEEDRVSR